MNVQTNRVNSTPMSIQFHIDFVKQPVEGTFEAFVNVFLAMFLLAMFAPFLVYPLYLLIDGFIQNDHSTIIMVISLINFTILSQTHRLLSASYPSFQFP